MLKYFLILWGFNTFDYKKYLFKIQLAYVDVVWIILRWILGEKGAKIKEQNNFTLKRKPLLLGLDGASCPMLILQFHYFHLGHKKHHNLSEGLGFHFCSLSYWMTSAISPSFLHFKTKKNGLALCSQGSIHGKLLVLWTQLLEILIFIWPNTQELILWRKEISPWDFLVQSRNH